MALSDLEILARLIQCEAGGEGENGMQAVASVIMNRVHITYGSTADSTPFAKWYFSKDNLYVLWKR